MYSLNVPIPGAVERVATDLYPALGALGTVRERHTLVLKRLPVADRGGFDRVAKEVRQALRGAPAVEAQLSGISTFDDPVSGPGPVVYLAVDSPGLYDLHDRLVAALGAVDGLEGPDWVPHITLARGGDDAAVARLEDRTIDPVTWTVGSLEFYDARHGERAGTLSLPG